MAKTESESQSESEKKEKKTILKSGTDAKKRKPKYTESKFDPSVAPF